MRLSSCLALLILLMALIGSVDFALSSHGPIRMGLYFLTGLALHCLIAEFPRPGQNPAPRTPWWQGTALERGQTILGGASLALLEEWALGQAVDMEHWLSAVLGVVLAVAALRFFPIAAQRFSTLARKTDKRN